MRCLVPLAGFEQLGLPVFASDARGVVRFCNLPATRLLDPGSSKVIGTRCWKLARLRTRDEAILCSRDCPLRRQLKEGGDGLVRKVSLARGSGRGPGFALLAFSVPPQPQGRFLLWHVLRPLPRTVPLSDRRLSTALRERLGRLHLLSPRELEVLKALAAGMTPGTLGERLFISEATVRNHIQHVLGKLRLHRLMDAVLVALADRIDAVPPAG